MVKLELTTDEAEWLQAVLGLVMEISRKWDDRTDRPDYGNRIASELSLARMIAGEPREPK